MRTTARHKEPDAQAEVRKIADIDRRSVERRFYHVKMTAQPICSALPYVSPVFRTRDDEDKEGRIETFSKLFGEACRRVTYCLEIPVYFFGSFKNRLSITCGEREAPIARSKGEASAIGALDEASAMALRQAGAAIRAPGEDEIVKRQK